MSDVERVAKAIQAAFSHVEHQPPWEDLHDDSKESWFIVAEAAIGACAAILRERKEDK